MLTLRSRTGTGDDAGDAADPVCCVVFHDHVRLTAPAGTASHPRGQPPDEGTLTSRRGRRSRVDAGPGAVLVG